MSSSYERVRSTGSNSTDDTGTSGASSMESPPFALPPDDPQANHASTSSIKENKQTVFSDPNSTPSSSQEWSSNTEQTAKSTLVSSTDSHPAPETQSHSSSGANQAIPPRDAEHDGEGVETYVFDTGDSFLGESSTMLGQSLGGETLWSHGTTQQSHPAGGGSLDFSQLMKQADDRHQHSTLVQSRMPTVHEETTPGLVGSGQTPNSNGSSNVTPRTTNQSCNNWLYAMFFGQSQDHNLSAVPMMSLSPSRLEERMGAGRKVQARRLGENTFEVSMQIDPPSTVRDVMDVAGNPDFLRLWCEPVRALVITKSSEGARSATNRREEGGDREYEGEWIEATTSTLVSPSKHSSCLYSMGSTIWSAFGFPSYGKITMFVERLRGQIGLTIGPFSGGVAASHTITVQDDGPVVAVVDKVRLSRDEEHGVCCCGLCDPIKRCFMPRMASHMEQVVSSMLRLRALVEHGESYAVVGPSVMDEQHGVSSVPLLSSGVFS